MRKIKTAQLKTQNKDNDNEVYRISDGGAGLEDSMIQDYGRMRINNGDTTIDDRSRAKSGDTLMSIWNADPNQRKQSSDNIDKIDDEATIMSPNYNGRSARTVFNSIRLSFVAPDEGDPRRSIQNNFTLDEMFTKAGGFGKHNF